MYLPYGFHLEPLTTLSTLVPKDQEEKWFGPDGIRYVVIGRSMVKTPEFKRPDELRAIVQARIQDVDKPLCATPDLLVYKVAD